LCLIGYNHYLRTKMPLSMGDFVPLFSKLCHLLVYPVCFFDELVIIWADESLFGNPLMR